MQLSRPDASQGAASLSDWSSSRTHVVSAWTRSVIPGAMILLAGCIDVPTEAPIIDQRWLVPGDSATLSVDRVVPSSVTVVSNTFQVAVPTVTSSQVLSQFCSTCVVGVAGIPKPAFTADISTSANLPSDVSSGTLLSGTVVVGLSTTLPFDPVRPSSTARGLVAITLRNNGVVIGADTLNGATTPLPPNTRVDRTIALRAGAVLSGPINVQVSVVSPAGDPATFASTQNFVVQAVPSNVRLSRATVLLNNFSVSSSATSLDLAGVDSEIRDRTTGGAIVAAIVNPFALSGNMTLTISAPGFTTITKPLRLTANSLSTTSQRLELTRDEIRSMFGRSNLSVVVSGPVSGAGAGGAVEVLPGTQAIMNTRLEVALRVGGN